jgi:hypothetical protein
LVRSEVLGLWKRRERSRLRVAEVKELVEELELCKPGYQAVLGVV